ncbi:G-protein coupled receptor 87-like [Hoplias malabaricus]|uniref:G-protein coupled receptor 87-like n=1 Tax=Hoplias malabaricus TaxID=27720 RepID=UPI0034626C84
MAENSTNLTTSATVPSLVYASLFTLVFVLGLLLNSLAAWVFFQIRTKKRTFMLYLRNMLAADLLMTLTLPVTILREVNMEPFWLPLLSCRYTAVLFYSCMYINILFLGLVALDRYLKIVRPFGGKCGDCLYSYSFTLAMAVVVWLAMLILSVPNSILFRAYSMGESCMSQKTKMGLNWHKIVVYTNIVIFSTVLITLVTCYVSILRHIRLSSAQFVTGGPGGLREPRSEHNILVVPVMFFICFVPYHIWRIPFTLSQTDKLFSPEVHDMLLHGKKVMLLLSSCNVCLDPIIYFFMCKSFRSILARMIGIQTLRQKSSIYSSIPGKKPNLVMRFKEHSSSSISS